MITSALINELRRESGDEPKSTRMSRQGNASVNLFNVGKFPIIEGSYKIFIDTSLKTETSDYTLDKDNGDLFMISTPSASNTVAAQYKYAHWRDKNWNEAINKAIETLNARGFFRQIVNNTSILSISGGVQTYNGPSACVDLYDFKVKSGQNYVKPWVNWEYQQDANKLVLGSRPATAMSAQISYLRNLQTYDATSASLDILNDWKEIVKVKAQAIFYRSLAGKIAKQGAATIDEGHFSFTNLRAMANDLDAEFERLAARKKPTRPAKELQFLV